VRILTGLLFLLALTSMARAESSLGAGTVVLLGKDGSRRDLGARVALHSGALALAVEHFEGETVRTRAELSLVIPLRLGRGVTLAPILGMIPLDHAAQDGVTTWTVSGLGALRLMAPLVGPVSLILEPLRVEGRLFGLILEGGMPPARAGNGLLLVSSATLAVRF
jgi:hypothetical protein